MFSLKISKNTTEKLFSATLFFASFTAGCLAAFDNAKLSPLFSEAPGVLGGVACAFIVAAAAARFFVCCLRRSPKTHQAAVAGFLFFVSLFFLPFDLNMSLAVQSAFMTVVLTVLASSGVPLLILSGAFFLPARKPVREKFILSLSGVLCAACVYPFAARGVSFYAQSVVLGVFYVLCLAAFFACLYFCGADDSFADEPREEEKFVWQAAGLDFFGAFVLVGLWLSARRYVEEFIYAPSLVPALFLPIGIACLISAHLKISDACAKVFWFLQPFAAALFFVLYLLTFVGADPALHLPVYAVLAGGAACMAASAQSKTKYALESVLAGALTAAVLVGGVFPSVFYWNAEYPFFVILALTMRSGVFFKGRSVHQIWQDFAYPLALLFSFFCVYFKISGSSSFYMMMNAGVFIIVGALPMLRSYPLRYAMTCAVALIFGAFVFSRDVPLSVFRQKVSASRDFYGSTVVTAEQTEKGALLKLYLNSSLKGWEFFTPNGAGKELFPPYNVSGGAGKFFMAVRQVMPNPSVAVIGAGSGVLASYAANAYEDWRFFEPDPAVAQIMSGSRAPFSYFNAHTPYATVVTGEPASALLRSPAAYDIIITDTFAFRHFPSYLLTPDAFMAYFSKMKRGGALVFNFTAEPAEWKSALSFVLKQLNVYALSFRPVDMPDNRWIVLTENDALVRALQSTSPLWERLLP